MTPRVLPLPHQPRGTPDHSHPTSRVVTPSTPTPSARRDPRVLPLPHHLRGTPEHSHPPARRGLSTLAAQVLLVFAQDDGQCAGFCSACEWLGFKYSVARDMQAGLGCFLEQHHDVIVIDHRAPEKLDAEALCR